MSNMQCQLKQTFHLTTWHTQEDFQLRKIRSHKNWCATTQYYLNKMYRNTKVTKITQFHQITAVKMSYTMTTFCAPATPKVYMIPPYLKWCRMLLRARPSAQLVVKFSTLTSGYERVHWRTQLSKIFSLLVCCRLDMISFMMSFTYVNMGKKHINMGE